MTIQLADQDDILEWPAVNIRMTRAQAERVGAEGIDLPEGEPHVYPLGHVMHEILKPSLVPTCSLMMQLTIGPPIGRDPGLEATE